MTNSTVKLPRDANIGSMWKDNYENIFNCVEEKVVAIRHTLICVTLRLYLKAR